MEMSIYFYIIIIPFYVGLFDRAKKKFLGDKDPEFSSESSHVVISKASSLFDVDYWQPQDTGNCNCSIQLSSFL